MLGLFETIVKARRRAMVLYKQYVRGVFDSHVCQGCMDVDLDRDVYVTRVTCHDAQVPCPAVVYLLFQHWDGCGQAQFVLQGLSASAQALQRYAKSVVARRIPRADRLLVVPWTVDAWYKEPAPLDLVGWWLSWCRERKGCPGVYAPRVLRGVDLYQFSPAFRQYSWPVCVWCPRA